VPPKCNVLVGGVVESHGLDVAVLQAGDTIGPDSSVSPLSSPMTDGIAGADGHAGIAFYTKPPTR
jgi:hypothetical protein